MQVHYILGELCFGGLALETNMAEILAHLDEQNKLEKQEVIDPPMKPNSLFPTVHFVLYFFSFFHIFTYFDTVLECFVMLGHCTVDYFFNSVFKGSNFPVVKVILACFAFSFALQYDKSSRMNCK